MKIPTYYNGVITPFDSAVIPLSDRSVFFADAIYEVMIGRGRKIYQLEDHFNRLKSNCEAIGLELDITEDKLLEIIDELICLSLPDEFYAYVQISGNSERRSHARSCLKSNLLIYVSEIKIPSVPPEIKAITYPDLRYGYCNLKTVNLLPAVLSMREATVKGADIAIFHKNSKITECSHANIAILKNDTIITPPLSQHILPGITRRTLIDVCAKNSISCMECAVSLLDLFSSDAVIITSTTKLLQICTQIDGITLPQNGNSLIHLLFSDIYSDFLNKTS